MANECSQSSAVLAQWPILTILGLAYLLVRSKGTCAPGSTFSDQVNQEQEQMEKENAEEIKTRPGKQEIETRLGYVYAQAPVEQHLNPQMLLVQQAIHAPAPDRPQQALMQVQQLSQASPLQTFSPSLPTSLPHGWEMKWDQAGRSFYINHTTKTSQWEPPVPEQEKAQKEAPVQQHGDVHVQHLHGVWKAQYLNGQLMEVLIHEDDGKVMASRLPGDSGTVNWFLDTTALDTTAATSLCANPAGTSTPAEPIRSVSPSTPTGTALPGVFVAGADAAMTLQMSQMAQNTPSVDALLPPGWKAGRDQRGNQYYYNKELNVTQWSRPAPSGDDGAVAVRSDLPSTPTSTALSGVVVAGADDAITSASVDAPLPPGWKTGKDQSGNQYYYNKELNVTQWSRPAPLQMAQVAQTLDQQQGSGGYGMPVLGVSFGAEDLAIEPSDSPESMSRDIQRTSHPKAWACWNLFQELVLERLVFIIPVLANTAVGNPYLLFLYCFDLGILFWAFSYKRYIPGCMYNHIHVLMTGVKFKPEFVSMKSPKNFSGKKKLIVGLGAISMLVQTVATISEAWCIFDPNASSVQKTPTGITLILIKLFGVVSLMLNGAKPLVAFVATTGFIVFSTWAYLSFMVLNMCEMMFEKRQEGGKRCMGFPIPDVGSNAHTDKWMYNLWALIWECL